jgi:hypothetical protein
MKNNKLEKIINAFRQLKEDGMVVGGPTNSVGGGKIAGTPQADPGNPPVFKNKKNSIYLGLLGSRKKWMKPKE